jgi:cyclophilin family peptidyl-prolyl cis-trans isomerase
VKATALCLALVVALLGACGGDDGDDDAAAPPQPPAGETGAGGCRDVEAPAPRTPPAVTAPREVLSQAVAYRVTVTTSCGEFTIQLDQKTSPRAVASFVALARDGYFDDTTFHRIVPGFVIQGGDPGATGAGGPGYQTVDTPAANTKYTEGTVAMAKGASDPRGAAGSQFFVMTADAPTLPPDYAVIGRVTEGLDVVLRIGALGGPDELPTQAVVVERMTVTEE